MIRLNDWQALSSKDSKVEAKLSDILGDNVPLTESSIFRPKHSKYCLSNDLEANYIAQQKRAEVEDLKFWSDFQNGCTDRGLFVKVTSMVSVNISTACLRADVVDEYERKCTLYLNLSWLQQQESLGRPVKDILKGRLRPANRLFKDDIICLYDHVVSKIIIFGNKFHF